MATSAPSPSAPSRKTSSTPPSTWYIALGSAITLWMAYPPIHFWPIAWVGTAGWCWFVAQPRIRARRPYRLLYVAGLVQWLLVMQAVRLPHWSAYFGWLALSAYLAVYVPLFISLSRVLVHQRRWPLWLACPIIWTGLELFRSYFLTGFAMALLAHTQFKWPAILQVATFGGAYAVSFLMVLLAASLAQSIAAYLSTDKEPIGKESVGKESTNKETAGTATSYRPPMFAAIVIGSAIFFGHYQIQESPSASDIQTNDTVSVALIQGCVDTTFDAARDPAKTLDDYRRITSDALSKNPEVDLIVWPESMQTIPWFSVTPPVQSDPDFPRSKAEFQAQLSYGSDYCRHEARWFARNFKTAALFGSPGYDFGDHPVRRYNSALWIDATGTEMGRYDKMHPVMFGEYVPLGDVFPFLYRLTPMGNGLAAGTQPLAVSISPSSSSDPEDALTFCPCICFENTVPHLVRRQVRQLTDQGQAPDALITITNDGWFWGSNLLDQHLACGVFRAVEMRRPMLIAANTGFSVWVNKRGQVLETGPRHAEGTVIAHIGAHRDTPTWYEKMGDTTFGFPCAIVMGLAAFSGWTGRQRP